MTIPILVKFCCKLCIAYYLMPVTEAEDGINWPTVAISWVFSLVTTVVVVAIAVFIAGRKRRKKQKKEPVVTEGESHPFRRELSVQSEVSDVTRVSDQSSQPLYKNAAGYNRVPSRESNINRRKTDFISTWCNKHGLSEVIAANLRENGFTSQDQVDSLVATDVLTLGLPNVAQQVQLRHVLETLKRDGENHVTRENQRENHVARESQRDSGENPRRAESGGRPVPGSHNRTRSGSSSDRSRPRSSITEEVGSLGCSSPKQTTPPGISPQYSSSFPYSRSMSEHMHSSEKSSHPRHSRLNFNGLLSDSGLYELAESLGLEWRHLGAVLGVGKAQQEHILHDCPNNTKQQIYEMLRLWRESIARGEKEQVKAQLADALTRIKRKDLAEKILREQVHGSDPNLGGGHRINSIV